MDSAHSYYRVLLGVQAYSTRKKKNAVDNRMKERGVVGDIRQWGVGGLVEKKTEIDWMADEV